ncbi:MAG: rubredoxin [Desulfitobacteriaceae bacterium]|nr:rubredoxin [Desulfitobacteriaceae bacterium]MDD4753467.1 rubredoxin [Desulfitobacteriaceae bacterium]
MEQWGCVVCGYLYDPEEGDPENGISPKIEFEDLADNWICPDCGADKDHFEKIE